MQNSPLQIATMREFVLLFGLLVSALASSVPALAAPPARNQQTHLEREIAALTMISELELTEDQLKAIEPICKETAVKAPSTTGPATSKHACVTGVSSCAMNSRAMAARL